MALITGVFTVFLFLFRQEINEISDMETNTEVKWNVDLTNCPKGLGQLVRYVEGSL